MDVRYTTDPEACLRMSPGELRKLFLIDSLFVPDATPMVYSDIDRSITGSAVPVAGPLELQPQKKEMAAEYFAERRELGVINIGGAGAISADGQDFTLEPKDLVYIGRGTRKIAFSSADRKKPAQFYFVSYPAHKSFPSTLIPFRKATPTPLGSVQDANKRTIYKYIQPGNVESCQLVMGMTELAEGCVWNTFPPHTHQRRSEVYMYFNLPAEALVVHLMGTPAATKHIILRDRQAVLSPPWSIHAGVATRNYSFVWAMGGENQAFDDMDPVGLDTIQ